MRPTLYGNRHAVSAGHYLAAAAGNEILEAGIFRVKISPISAARWAHLFRVAGVILSFSPVGHGARDQPSSSPC